MKNASFPIFLTAAFIPLFAFAENQTGTDAQEQTWADEQHQEVQTTLNSWANTIDGWVGESDPNQPASAGLRVILDSQWNRYDKFSAKP
ncbi:MAG TPA: hypothetical protein DD638_08155, partial [Pasteurellaceae bacterium]|nr:hypothetical protein [Pasteurellaceae bacterium]